MAFGSADVSDNLFAAPVEALFRRVDSPVGERGWHLVRNFLAPVTLRIAAQRIELVYARGLGQYLTPGLTLTPAQTTMTVAKAGVYAWRAAAPLRIILEGPSRRGALQLAVLAPKHGRNAQMFSIWNALVLAGVHATTAPCREWVADG